MRVKQRTKPGECARVRCTAAAADLFCPRHEEEWREEGSPPVKSESERVNPLDLDKELQDQLRQEAERIGLAVVKVSKFLLSIPEQRNRLSKMIDRAAERKKELEVQRTSVTQPLNQVLRTINGWFKPVTEQIDSFMREGKRVLKEELDRVDAEAKAALKAIEDAGGDGDAATFLAAHASSEVPEGMTAVQVYSIQVVDYSQVPFKYTVLNERSALLDLKAGLDIPGLKLRVSTELRRTGR